MADKLRVLFAIGSMGGGGAERQTIHYLRSLDRERFEPRLYLTEARGELLSAVPADVPVASFDQRVKIPRGYFPGRIHRLQVADLADALAEQQIDVLVAVTFFETLIAAGAVRRRPTPWLAIEMADPRLDFPMQVRRFGWLKRRLLARAYRTASRAVAVSQGVREGMSQFYGLRPDRIAVLPNFIDLAEVDRRAAESPAVLRGSAEEFRIVAIGRLHEQKGHRFLLQTIDRLVNRDGRKSLRLDLLGQGPLAAELREFVRAKQLDGVVHFAGFQANPLAWLQQADLFCLPSLFEGLPLALLEAMACGVPVVASDCPSGPREVLDGGRYGRLVPPADPDALAAAITDAIEHRHAWQATARDARRRIEAEYSLPVGSQRLERLLDEVSPVSIGRQVFGDDK